MGRSKRVAIARAIVTDPLILFADEPWQSRHAWTRPRDNAAADLRLNREQGILVCDGHARGGHRYYAGRVDPSSTASSNPTPATGTQLMLLLERPVARAARHPPQPAALGFLTVLGIVIGVSAVVDGHARQRRHALDPDQIGNMGSNLLTPGAPDGT